MRITKSAIALALFLLCSVVAHADTTLATVTVRAPHHAYHNAPATFLLSPELTQTLDTQNGGGIFLATKDGKATLPCQTAAEGKQTRVDFLIPDLARGQEREYELRWQSEKAPKAVSAEKVAETMEIHIGSSLFTTYTTKLGPNKPFFYPILTPEGQNFTRRWPMEQNTGESNDHPHHRGLWFTHGSVNGIDFWSEEKNTGKTVNREFLFIQSGPVYGGFQAVTEWHRPDDNVIAVDYRTIRVYPLPNGDRLMDFDITLKPHGGPLVFGDTKEGMFGLRLADALAPSRKEGGHSENSGGLKDAAIWGKAADWVDYYGPIGGQTYGVAIFDNPANLRHPETWHARDYGLFAVNPFGLHDFGLGAKGAGDYTVPEDKPLTLRYRLLFHKGDTSAASVAAQYAAYADPPEITIKGVHGGT